ncbi:fatty acid desaturase [Streptomyces griseus]|uniref:fatty acid desaturase n=1 Tax=Streptomyces griseus TaxID=1911 RepID=UPI0004CA7579|nr:fatty acid desaturase [Streptomyces griseus]
MPSGAHGADAPDTERADPREALRRLPGPLQLPLTCLIGKAYRGQRGPALTPTFHLVGALGSLTAGVALGSWALAAMPALSWWPVPLLAVSWAVTLHGMRNLRMMVFHQCAHRNMWRRKVPDQFLGHLLAGLLLIQAFDAYSREHVKDHHAVHHMTLRDPTVQAFLLTLGLRPGMTRLRMWHIVLRKLVSPAYHLRFLVARLRGYWATASTSGRAMTLVAYTTLAAALTWWGTWTAFLVCWLVPLTVLFQISNTLRLCVKHTFPQPGSTSRGKEHFASLTNAIFLCSTPPARALTGPPKWRAWLRWWGGLLLVHFPSRYLVLTGDTVCHDYHHRHPMSREWADYIFSRQRDIDCGHPGWPPYQEAWGLVPAINRVFDSLTTADPDVYDVARIEHAAEGSRAAFLAFDD